MFIFKTWKRLMLRMCIEMLHKVHLQMKKQRQGSNEDAEQLYSS